MTHAATTAPKGHSASRAGVKVSALFAALLGIGILYGVGFAGPAVIHNAAHDSRHAAAFPCH